MVEFYRAVCEECGPQSSSSDEIDVWRSTRFPREDHAERHAARHDREAHGQTETASVVREEQG